MRVLELIQLAVYIGLMGIHLFTGLSAFGLVSNSHLDMLTELTGQMLGVIL